MGYSTGTYLEAKAVLEKQRIKNETELQKRRDILFSRSPRAEELECSIGRTSVAAAKAVLAGKDVKMELARLKLQNQAMQKELTDIIRGFGFSDDYLEMRYQCEKCRDYGYADGKMCSCMKKLLRDIEYRKLNETSPLMLSDFDSFSLEYYSKVSAEDGQYTDYYHMSKLLGFCQRYADNFSLESDSLLFQGSPGLGKTHLSLAVAKTAIDKGFGVIYVSAPVILGKIEKEHFNSRSENMSENAILDCDLLILDDLGTEFVTPFTISAIYNIINTRMITSKPTIISTNLTLNEIEEKYNTRTVSRIIGMLKRVEFVGSDIRQQKKRKKS